ENESGGRRAGGTCWRRAGAWWAAALTCGMLVAVPAPAQTPPAEPDSVAPDSVHFFGTSSRSAVPAGVVIPGRRAVVWTGAISPPVFNERAEPGTRERYGDTKIQAVGVLRRIDEQ